MEKLADQTGLMKHELILYITWKNSRSLSKKHQQLSNDIKNVFIIIIVLIT